MIDRDASTPSPIRPNGLGPTGKTIEDSRRSHFIRAAVIGTVVGFVAVAFQRSLTLAENVRLAALEWAATQGAAGAIVLGVSVVALIVAVGVVTARYCPEAAGSGIPHVKGLLVSHERMRAWRIIVAKFVGGIIGIGAGLSLGREGPTIQLGAASGAVVADRMGVRQRSVSRMLTCGAGAGLAAAFNAPLAGFVFVIEELRREVSTRTYGSGLIACLIADMISRLLNGQLPVFHVKNFPTPPLSILPWAAVVGVGSAIIGIVFARGILAARAVSASRGIAPVWVRCGVFGVIVAVALFVVPHATGGGHHTAEMILKGDYDGVGAVRFLLIIIASKLILTAVSYATGAPGGFFMPLLVVGAGGGALFGQMFAKLAPDTARYPESFAVIGMAAIFSGVVRAPLTGIVLILEMTGNYEQTFPLSIACLVSYLVAERFGPPPIYDALLHAAQPDVHPAEDSEPFIIHRVVETGAPLDGSTLAEAQLPDGCLVIAVHRGGRAFVPDGRTRLRSGDDLVISTTPTPDRNWKMIDAWVRAD